MDPQQLLQMLGMNQPQMSSSLQAYMGMMGGGHFGGVIPQSMSSYPFRPQGPNLVQPSSENKMSFGASPWPGVWG